jgi:polyhydroxybutyrate depolymerase
MRHPLLAILFCFSALVAASADTAIPTPRQWKVDGVERTGLVYVPETATTAKTPLLFAFHGHGGTARNAATRWEYHRLWPEAIVVYLQGLPTPGALTDPQGNLPGWQSKAGAEGDRDLKFFDVVLASLKKQYKVDDKRIYVTGHSNGGGFTYLLWAERGDTFAAVAPAAAFTRDVAALKPKPAMHIAGENDQLVRFPIQQRMMESVRKIDGCEAEGKAWAKSGDLVGTIYPSKTGTPFVSVIYPGPHMLPSGVPALVVKFFKEQAAAKAVPKVASENSSSAAAKP